MADPSRKSTIHDIARIAGASPSTVSAALSGKWKSRRISEARVEEIRRIAEAEGYSINMQARGLRLARSGMVGMIIPVHDNRVFSSMSQSFESFARARGLVPVIASTLRDAEQERRIVESFISYSLDALFVTGAADPEGVHALCASAGLRHIFLDLPGPGAPSVISDNYSGALQLTETLLDGMGREAGPLWFLGGDVKDHATQQRIKGFHEALWKRGIPVVEGQINPCGYPPQLAQKALADLVAGLGHLPAGLFVNSLTAFTGVLRYLADLPDHEVAQMRLGCYDYDPFATFLRFPAHLVRQDVHRLIEISFELMDREAFEETVIEVAPKLLAPGEVDYGPYGEVG